MASPARASFSCSLVLLVGGKFSVALPDTHVGGNYLFLLAPTVYVGNAQEWRARKGELPVAL